MKKDIKKVVIVSEVPVSSGSKVKRIVIPKPIAEAMNIQKGDQLVIEYEAENDRINIKKF